MSYQTELVKLQESQAVQVEKLRVEWETRACLPPTLQDRDWSVHMYPLYFRAGSLHWGHNRYRSLPVGPDPTLSDVLLLATTHLPVPLCLTRDGWATIHTADEARAHVDAQQARMAEGHTTSATCQPIAEFWVEFDWKFQQSAAIHWIAMLGGRLFEFRVGFPLGAFRNVAVPDIRYSHPNQYVRAGDRLTHRSLTIRPAFAIQKNARAEYLRRESSFTLYYDSANGEHADITLVDFITAVQEN